MKQPRTPAINLKRLCEKASLPYDTVRERYLQSAQVDCTNEQKDAISSEIEEQTSKIKKLFSI